jgi:acetolactate synthase regulatory subunit
MLNLQVPCSHGALVWRSALIVTSIRSVHGIFANISKLESHVNVYIVQKRSKGIQNESKWIKMVQAIYVQWLENDTPY